MNSQLQKQILIGGLAGILVMALIIIFLGGKRDELKALNAENQVLQQEVDKGYNLKANYEKLKNEVAEQEKLIDELIKIMPTDADRGEIPYKIKKIADQAGIDQVSFNVESPIKKEYYTEHPFTFTFRAGFHSFGQFASLISGHDKIINLSDLQLKRDLNKGLYPIAISCKVSAFVYNPTPVASAAPRAARPGAAAGGKGEGE